MKAYRGVLYLVLAMTVIAVPGLVLVPSTAQAGDDPAQTDSDAETRVSRIILLEEDNVQIVGDRLLLLEKDRKVIAPDGTYRFPDGRLLTVRGGRLKEEITSIGEDTQAGRPELPVQSGRPEMPTQAGRPEMPVDPLKDPGPAGVRTVGDDAQSGRPELPAVQSGRPEMPGKAGGVRMPVQTGRPEMSGRVPAPKMSSPAGQPGFSGRQLSTPVLQEGQEDRLPRPVQISPANHSTFNRFPRSTTVRWQHVEGAASYIVEVQYCGGTCAQNAWPLVTQLGLMTTSYTFNFVGAQPGRWRVWAVNHDGEEGLKSFWWEFEYTQ